MNEDSALLSSASASAPHLFERWQNVSARDTFATELAAPPSERQNGAAEFYSGETLTLFG